MYKIYENFINIWIKELNVDNVSDLTFIILK